MQNRIRSLIQLIAGKQRQKGNIFLLSGVMVFSICNGALANEIAVGGSSDRVVDFKQQSASVDVKHMANWVLESRDNRRMPFAIIDKVNAKVFVFDADGHLLGAAAALLGIGRGDRYDAVTGSLKMGSIKPAERITPAGRFNVSLQRDIHGKEVLLIDYDAAIALHPVVKGTPAERRAERLSSLTAEDNRISYGCINVPVKFYEKIVSPAFTKTNGVVYILPETSSAKTVFGF